MATDNFAAFADIVNKRFQDMAKGQNVFVVDVDKETIWNTYINAFPEGTNPIFKERTEHDCVCCKQFVRRIGNVIAVANNGGIQTVWDTAAKDGPEPYQTVAKALQELVKATAIRDIFRTKEARFGARETRSLDDNGKVLKWNHFYTGDIPRHLVNRAPDTEIGRYRTTAQVFERGLTELTTEAVDTVLSLIDANSLYRGQEHRALVVEFQKAQQKYAEAKNKSVFVWKEAEGRAARFRNTVIGTLVQDLSEGMDVEQAVRAFETKVAPHNYKRTTAIITPGMVKKAMQTIEELGLEPALQRRFARIEDISVNDVLWVDRQVEPKMKDGGLGDMLMTHAQSQVDHGDDEKRAQDVSIDDFMTRVLPETQAMELLFKGTHMGNLMSLTAPMDPEPRQLFKWSNDFAWSYAGNIADSIKEKVKRAGGNVTNAQLRVSLSWFNYDDLDIHVHEPGGDHIYYGHRHGRGGGILDVDMNAGGRHSRDPVENVTWKTMRDGAYRVVVNNFSKREDKDVGFVVEVENMGKLSHFNYHKAVRNRQDIHVVTLHVKNGVIQRMELGDNSITTTAVSQEKWGLQTENYIKVNAVTLSPNYWGDDAVGNKHTFFVLEGALNDEPCRGIYNEFLHPRLTEHRKVFEVIGDKTKCQPTDGQLSGLGFSSTKEDSVIVRVTQGQSKRLFNVKFGA